MCVLNLAIMRLLAKIAKISSHNIINSSFKVLTIGFSQIQSHTCIAHFSALNKVDKENYVISG